MQIHVATVMFLSWRQSFDLLEQGLVARVEMGKGDDQR